MLELVRIAGCLFFLCAAGVVSAEPLRSGDVVGDWKFGCVALAESQTRCALTQRILTEPGVPPLAQISFERVVDPEQIVAALVVPIGAEVSSNALLAAGDQGLALPYIYCTPESCLARALVTVESLTPFLASDQLGVIYKRYGAERTIRIPASSNGLKDAFQRLGLQHAE